MDKRLDKGLMDISDVASKARNRFQSESAKVYGIADTIGIKILDVSKQAKFYAEQGDKELQEKALKAAEAAVLEMKEQAEILREAAFKMHETLSVRMEEIEAMISEVKASVKK